MTPALEICSDKAEKDFKLAMKSTSPKHEHSSDITITAYQTLKLSSSTDDPSPQEKYGLVKMEKRVRLDRLLIGVHFNFSSGLQITHPAFQGPLKEDDLLHAAHEEAEPQSSPWQNWNDVLKSQATECLTIASALICCVTLLRRKQQAPGLQQHQIQDVNVAQSIAEEKSQSCSPERVAEVGLSRSSESAGATLSMDGLSGELEDQISK